MRYCVCLNGSATTWRVFLRFSCPDGSPRARAASCRRNRILAHWSLLAPAYTTHCGVMRGKGWPSLACWCQESCSLQQLVTVTQFFSCMKYNRVIGLAVFSTCIIESLRVVKKNVLTFVRWYYWCILEIWYSYSSVMYTHFLWPIYIFHLSAIYDWRFEIFIKKIDDILNITPIVSPFV